MMRNLVFALLFVGCVTPSVEHLSIEPGTTEADILVRLGAPSYVSATQDGGKLLVFESVRRVKDPDLILDTTPKATCVGNCGDVTVIQPRGSAVVVHGRSHQKKTIYTFAIAPDGHVAWATKSHR